LLILAAAYLLASGLSVKPRAAAQEAANKSNFDGPAELPRIHVKTSLADTPAPGKSRLVKSGDNLQEAIDSASCGDTIKVQAGATFTGRFRLPRKSCDDSHWVVLRTSAPDGDLPGEGTRITPCYAGVASLPGRPDFHCSSPRNVMAKIVFNGRAGAGPIVFDAGANHYRLLGLEITRDSPGIGIVNLAGPVENNPADHIIFDRVWMHGTAQDETRRGVFLSGTTYMGIIDSFFSDFHCVARGGCTDSQAIAGGAGDVAMGAWKIENNYLEAAGENILLGGSHASFTPADIEIRHNYMYKPIAWMRGQPGFMGGESGNPFIVKNLFELKNAQRLLLEGNVLENTWGGFTQPGFAIALSPKNQHGNVCPLCRVTDITIRYNKISHMGGGLSIANVLSDTGGAAADGGRYSLHDLVFDDIDGATYNGFGTFLLLIANTPKLHDVKIDHVTALPPRVFLNIGSKQEKFANFVFTNNIVDAGQRQVTSTGGGPANCAFHPDPSNVLKNCFESVTFTNNAIIDGSGWPPGNFYPKDQESVGFLNPNHGKNGDYHLCRAKNQFCKAASRYLHAGTDGKDLGADMDAIDAATKGVN
jgi:hypothetical protein